MDFGIAVIALLFAALIAFIVAAILDAVKKNR